MTENTYPSQPAAVRFLSQSEPVSILEGDYLILTYDGGASVYVYPPPLSGEIDTYYYIGLDGISDIAVFRPESGLWAIRGLTRAYFGRPGDYPVPAAYGGPGVDRIGVFRPATGLWAIRDLTRAYFGAGGDIPVTR